MSDECGRLVGDVGEVVVSTARRAQGEQLHPHAVDRLAQAREPQRLVVSVVGRAGVLRCGGVDSRLESGPRWFCRAHAKPRIVDDLVEAALGAERGHVDPQCLGVGIAGRHHRGRSAGKRLLRLDYDLAVVRGRAALQERERVLARPRIPAVEKFGPVRDRADDRAVAVGIDHEPRPTVGLIGRHLDAERLTDVGAHGERGLVPIAVIAADVFDVGAHDDVAADRHRRDRDREAIAVEGCERVVVVGGLCWRLAPAAAASLDPEIGHRGGGGLLGSSAVEVCNRGRSSAIRVVLGCVVGGAALWLALQCCPRCTALLLHVGQLMGEQGVAVDRAGGVLSRRKGDVVPDRERVR